MSTAKFQHADQLTPFLSELLLLGNANQVGTPSKAGNRFEKLYTYQAQNLLTLGCQYVKLRTTLPSTVSLCPLILSQL
jgi:hypothetical protein